MVPELNSSKNKKAVLLIEEYPFFLGSGSETTQSISGKNVFLTSVAERINAFNHPLYKGQNPTSTCLLSCACCVLLSDPNLFSEILSTSESNHIHITSVGAEIENAKNRVY